MQRRNNKGGGGWNEPTDAALHGSCERRKIMMDYIFIVLSALMTLGLCWVMDRDNFAAHVAAVIFIQTCTLFWIVFPFC